MVTSAAVCGVVLVPINVLFAMMRQLECCEKTANEYLPESKLISPHISALLMKSYPPLFTPMAALVNLVVALVHGLIICMVLKMNWVCWF